ITSLTFGSLIIKWAREQKGNLRGKEWEKVIFRRVGRKAARDSTIHLSLIQHLSPFLSLSDAFLPHPQHTFPPLLTANSLLWKIGNIGETGTYQLASWDSGIKGMRR
ncbi:hypothetical protein ILYODFUR_022535, partial [Ilyodon furcidens]